jgi:L-lactate dehydrogenase (cytochrome)
VTKRRLPRPNELKQILRPKPIVLNPTDRRLASAHTIADLRMLARKRTPRAAFAVRARRSATSSSTRTFCVECPM